MLNWLIAEHFEDDLYGFLCFFMSKHLIWDGFYHSHKQWEWGMQWGEYSAWRNIFYYYTTCSSVLNISTHTVMGGIHVYEHTCIQYVHRHKDTNPSSHHKFRNTVSVFPWELFVAYKIFFILLLFFLHLTLLHYYLSCSARLFLLFLSSHVQYAFYSLLYKNCRFSHDDTSWITSMLPMD